MQKDTIRACLALHRNKSLSNLQRITLLNAASSAEEVFDLSHAEVVACGLKSDLIMTALKAWDRAAVEQDLALIDDLNISIVPINSPSYPSLLKEIHNPPALLYVRGDIELLSSPQLAIVGSRKGSRAGLGNAHSFARAFAASGCTITSGMALGIDAEGHRGALAGGGCTIAVLGTGVDIVYPRRNGELYQSIIEQGAVISEMPLGATPRPSQFPSRNRIISGLSLGVLIVEAALKSGSLITARLAMEQNREVFAMPGSIHNPASRGCHALIREGAKLVETAEHILEELAGWLPAKGAMGLSEQQKDKDKQTVGLTHREEQLLQYLGYERQCLDELQLQCRWSASELMATLTSLEIKNVLECCEGYYQRIKSD